MTAKLHEKETLHRDASPDDSAELESEENTQNIRDMWATERSNELVPRKLGNSKFDFFLGLIGYLLQRIF